MYYRSFYDSPCGRLSLVARDEDLFGIWLEGQDYFQKGLENIELLEVKTPLLEQVESWLSHYFSGQPVRNKDFPLAKRGSSFQERVWSLLDTIPYGETRTYGQLAAALECGSAQAVGNAVGKNPWLILRPCHRVLPASGGLGGFVAGEQTKEQLLALEAGQTHEESFVFGKPES